MDAEAAAVGAPTPILPTAAGGQPGSGEGPSRGVVVVAPTRYHATVRLDPARAGADASRIGEEVLAHLVGLVGADVTVSLGIEAEAAAGFRR